VSVSIAMESESRDEPSALPVAIAVAIVAHVAVALSSPRVAAHRLEVPPPLEVELAAERPPPPPAAPAPIQDSKLTAPLPTARAHSVDKPAALARAGKLVASAGSSSDGDAPLDFVNDPNGGSYGFGVVSKSGTAASATAAPSAERPSAPPPRVSAAPALALPQDLSEKPRLLGDDPCRGFYPTTALVDSGSVVVRVVVDSGVRVQSIALASETPAGEGFGTAAERCLRDKRFSPALDTAGLHVATTTTVRVHFDR